MKYTPFSRREIDLISQIKFTSLNKRYDDQHSKADIIKYYTIMAPYIIPFIKNRPFSMIHFPHGVTGDFFYQKQRPSDAPKFIRSLAIEGSQKTVDWCLINDRPSLLYLANRNVIEVHSWFSAHPHLDRSTYAIIDLDPSGATGFQQARQVALLLRPLIERSKLPYVVMTSGATGIHIRLKVRLQSFKRIQELLKRICAPLLKEYPELVTTTRGIKERGDKVYLDIVQNAAGKTIIAPYSLRARPGLPVATPLTWEELENTKLKPGDFNIDNILERLSRVGIIRP